MPNCECIHCQGELVSPLCVKIESTRGCDLDKYIISVDKSLASLEQPHEIDVKTLSAETNLSRDEIIQILINKVIELKNTNTSIKICDNVDWTPLNSCTSCPNDFCTQLQNLINITGLLKT